MTPFEDLIQGLSFLLEANLYPDAHQSCLIHFPHDEISVQIDLDNSGDRILLGTQIGRVTPGPYRLHLFTQAMKANGTSTTPHGILSFSEKNDALVLYQFLNLNNLDREKLYRFLQLFKDHAKLWKNALINGEIPNFGEEASRATDGMYGLRP